MKNGDFVKSALGEVRVAIGRLTPMTSEERCFRSGHWFQGARDFGQRAALHLDAHAAHLPNVPYTGDEIRIAFDDVMELEAHVHALEESVRITKDTLIAKRGLALRRVRDVVRALRALISDPFVRDGVRQEIQRCLDRLRDRGAQQPDTGIAPALDAPESDQTESDEESI